MYAYHQHNGALYKDEVQIGTGYSGQPPHKNDTTSFLSAKYPITSNDEKT